MGEVSYELMFKLCEYSYVRDQAYKESGLATSAIPTEQAKDIAMRLRGTSDFLKALEEEPEVPSIYVLHMLRSIGMGNETPYDVYAIGKWLQKKHGHDAVPHKTELECAAGTWWVMRQALRGEDVSYQG